MTRRREPGSMHDAVLSAVGALGRGLAASIIGKSKSLIQQYVDEDSDMMIPLDRAVRIDKACKARGLPTHIRDWFNAEVDATEPEDVPGCVNAHSLDLFAAAGDLAEAIRHGTCPEGEAGQELSPAEYDVILKAAKNCDMKLRALIHKCEVMKARREANPGGEYKAPSVVTHMSGKR